MVQSKDIDLCGIGTPLVDIFVRVSDQQLSLLGVEKGTMRLVDGKAQEQLLGACGEHSPQMVSGGSVANSVIAVAQLGGRGAFLCCIGDDPMGAHYQGEFKELGIELPVPTVGGATGTCASIITPDGERSMRTNVGVTAQFSTAQIDERTIARSEWMLIEGYLFCNAPGSIQALGEAVRLAKKHKTKIAFTCSEPFIIEQFRDPVNQLIASADLVFANETEACAFTGSSNAEDAFSRFRQIVPGVVVTVGERGAYMALGEREAHIPAFPGKPLDLTGAGDMFAGAFLYGITHQCDPRIATRAACYLARKVIDQIGARLHTGTQKAWDEIIEGKVN